MKISENDISKTTHDLRAMLTYLEIKIFENFGYPKMYYTDLAILFQVLCTIHVHEHETNYTGTLTSTGWIFLCVDGITNSIAI